MNIQSNITTSQNPIQFKMNLFTRNKKLGTNAVDTYERTFKNSSPQKPENVVKRIYHSIKEKFTNSIGIEQHPDKPIITKKSKTRNKVKENNEGRIITPQNGIPEPEFCTDYEKCIAGLKNGKDVTPLWIKQNRDLLDDIGWSSDINDDGMLLRNINKNKEGFLNTVDNTYVNKKASYIDSIRKEYIDSIRMQHFGADLKELKEKNLLGLDALIKYGTREDMLKLSLEYGVSKDNDVMQKYCKLVRKVGEPEDSVKIFPKLGDRYTDIFDDTTKKEAMKTVKKLMVDDAPDGFNKNAEFSEYKTMEIYLTSKDPEMVDMAKTIMKRLSDENPWMLK